MADDQPVDEIYQSRPALDGFFFLYTFPFPPMNTVAHPPHPINEPPQTFAPNSPERVSLRHALEDLKAQHIEIPAFIHGEAVTTDRTFSVRAPHEHQRELATAHFCGADEVEQAIASALEARPRWSQMDWQDRAGIFLKAAELVSGPYRDTINAATMLGQSKNAYQSDIEAACELCDFLRFNAHFLEQLYTEQPFSPDGQWNRMEYRPLEGFVFAVTPFNFTAIQCNLPTAPALMGNVALWKPSPRSLYSAYFIYKILEEAGLPPGVINMLPGAGADVGDPVLDSPHLAGLHFTGSQATFNHLWKTIGENLDTYRSYPRIVGETGGKDFIVAHPTADMAAVRTAIVRGAFEYQGQKCSAASRVYLPASRWPEIEAELATIVNDIKVGPVEDFTNYVNAVIDERAYDEITAYIEEAKADPDVTVLAGGTHSKEEGYFVDPTVLVVDDPKHVTMREEIFGPVVSVYIYEDADFEDTLTLVDETSPYALTGSIFAQDRDVIAHVTKRLEHAAGNFYINDKPTGSIVGQQPFGGLRKSGTNDKAGSIFNLTRWVSPRSIKETFVPATSYEYPHHQPDKAANGVSHAERTASEGTA